MDLARLGEIDRDSGILPSVQIADLIAARIGTRVLPWGTQLPNSYALAAHYGVTQPVVLRALHVLARDGLVVVRQGVPSRVREQ